MFTPLPPPPFTQVFGPGASAAPAADYTAYPYLTDELYPLPRKTLQQLVEDNAALEKGGPFLRLR